MATSAVTHLPASFYQPFISQISKLRRPSPIRGLYPLESKPGVISLLAGKPNGAMFPFTSLNFTIAPTTAPEYAQSIAAGTPLPQGQNKPIEVSGADLQAGLQYGATAGLPRLLEWLHGLQERSHGRVKGEGWRISVGAGSQDLIYKAVNALLDPGDAILVESPVYAGVLPMFQTLKCEQVEVPTDAFGIRSQDLRSILSSWPSDKPKPKVLYTVPYGCNPTGMTATEDRRREVIELSREHNFLILEDDPYFYLYFGDAPRPPSYFHLEKVIPTKDGSPNVGRVLRFDSFSKIVSAGMRMGFASGPTTLLDAMDLHTGTSNLQASSLVQSILIALVESWGYDGFDAHIRSVSAFYRAKRDVFQAAMKENMEGLAEWTPPEAGMFFWFKLLLKPSSSANTQGGAAAAEEDEGDSSDLVRTKAYENGVLALPGTVFLPNGRKTAFVRASFSLLEESDVREALKRLKEVVKQERGEA